MEVSRDELEARYSTRPARLRAVWLAVPLFLWFVAPTTASLSVGGGLVLVGLVLRGWAAGSIRKGEELTTTGPYAFVRHPLYLGSLVLGLGITVASGYLWWPGVFLLFYLAVYWRTMAGEARLLDAVYGSTYRDYAARVPALVPRLTPYRPDASSEASSEPGGVDGPEGVGFTWGRYGRNNEWEAAAGSLAVLGYLMLRWWLGS